MTPTLLAIACLLAITLGYIGTCAVSPFGPCRKCRGMGCKVKTNRRGKVRRGRDCRRCHATGRRIRVGRWIYNRATRTYEAGTDTRTGAVR
ncbi:hypothetical protein SRB5_51640 [Streptomyces sp. RB5]|uniref:Uncharacterized protein n=1 Tax=Streptomyces smaragdinus TaxID=2585196 RepID=A0A7K0CNB5_9ACTN|nr:hypothetical protein [Streptomyces smaragdinus]MQY14987.1 hypothetical protein [Streptomyces smaragdinus]